MAPQVLKSVVMGVVHPMRQKRPLVYLVRPGEELTKEEILEFLQDKVANWLIPDDVVFPRGDPKTNVGKFSKNELRARLRSPV